MGQGEIKGFSIFHKLLLAFLVLVSLVSGSMTVIYYVFSKQAIEQQTEERLNQLFSGIEEHFHNDVEIFEKDLRLLATNPLLDEFIMSSNIEYEINARSLERLFIQSRDLMKNVRSIAFVDYAGQEKIKVDGTGRVRNYGNIGSSRIFTQLAAAAAGGYRIEGPYRGAEGEACFSLGIHKTDADIGEFGGAVIIEYSLKHLFDHLGEITLFETNPIWIFAPDGEILKEPDAAQALFDPRSFFTEGIQATPAFLSVPQGQVVYQDVFFNANEPFMRVAVSIPRTLLLKDINHVLSFISIVSLIALAVTLLLVTSLSRFLTRPIMTLAQAATRLAGGDLSTNVDIRTSGEIQLLVDSFNKMTADLQETTVSKDYFNNIIQSMYDPLLVLDADYRILMVNPATCEMLGYAEPELLGGPIGQILDSGLLDKGTEIDGTRVPGVVDNQESVFTHKNGTEIPVIWSSSLMTDAAGAVTGHVCVVRDITERIKTEKALAEAQQQLVDAAHKAGMADIATGILHNLGNVLNSVNASAEEISHIIKTSKVDSLINANGLLQEHLDHLGEFLSQDEKGKMLPAFYLKLGDVLLEEKDRICRNMERIEDKIHTMKGIVETQQDYAKAEFHSEKEELTKIIDDVLKIHKDLIKTNGVEIQGDYDKPMRCKVHKYKLVQVLMNLVKNAVEAMMENDLHNKTKELRIETGNVDDRFEYIRVTDNGCGIPSENLVKIFNHGFTTKDKGHGFGLHASANSLTEMGGSISAASAGEDQGAVFTVKLPVGG
ncbi:MAG: PAS domain S-box protein [Desulfuromonadaceae bacterium]